MAGVAGPLLRTSRPSGIRFLDGLLVGSVVAGLVLSLLLVVTGDMISLLLGHATRTVLAVAALAVFGTLDLANRTPHVWRQVPQQLVNRMPPAQLGVTWGVDLGLLVTTQKTTSLIWGAIVFCALLAPSMSPLTLVVIALVSSVVVAAASTQSFAGRVIHRPGRRFQLGIRALSGSYLVAAAAVLASELLL